MRFKFAAIFGLESEKSFQALVQSYNQILHATQSLVNDNINLSDRLIDKYEIAIGWLGEDGTDPIAQDIDEAVARIEGLCKPVLQLVPS